MKKLQKVLALIFLTAFSLAGCSSLVQTNYQQLETVGFDKSAWQFYKSYEDAYQNMTSDYANLSDKSSSQYSSLYDNFDNRENIFRIQRDSLVVLDLFYEQTDSAIFVYDNLLNYNAVKIYDEKTKNYYYKLTYNELLGWNSVPNGDSEIDGLMAKIQLPTTVIGLISTNISQTNTVIQNGYTLALTQSSKFPTNASALSLPVNHTDSSGNKTVYNYQTSTTTTVFDTIAEKTITNASDVVTYHYKRETKIELKNNANYLTSTVTFSDNTTKSKTYKLDQEVRNIRLGFDKQVGHLEWYINYAGQGQIEVYGEAYYQGNEKYLVKEEDKVLISSPLPYSISSSFTTELNIDGSAYKFKFVPGEYEYEYIYNQNILKFGVYNNEPVATTLQKTASNVTMQYYE